MSDPVKAIAWRLRRCCGENAELTLDRSESATWQALLFDGARHRLSMRLHGKARDDTLAALRTEIAEQDFAIPGHVVIDLRLIAVDDGEDGEDQRIEVEALTVADGLSRPGRRP